MTAKTLAVVECDMCGLPHEWPPLAVNVRDARGRAKARGWVFARATGPARQVDICPPCALTLNWDGRADEPLCPATVGQRPYWMSPDQYDPCLCILPPGHDGDHACEHT